MSEIYFKPLYNLDDSILNRQPALEFPRVADSVLSGIMEGLIEQGYSEKMAKCFITSKILRCELDGNLEDGLKNFGKFYAKTIAFSYYGDCERYAEEG